MVSEGGARQSSHDGTSEAAKDRKANDIGTLYAVIGVVVGWILILIGIIGLLNSEVVNIHDSTSYWKTTQLGYSIFGILLGNFIALPSVVYLLLVGQRMKRPTS